MTNQKPDLDANLTAELDIPAIRAMPEGAEKTMQVNLVDNQFQQRIAHIAAEEYKMEATDAAYNMLVMYTAIMFSCGGTDKDTVSSLAVDAIGPLHDLMKSKAEESEDA